MEDALKSHKMTDNPKEVNYEELNLELRLNLQKMIGVVNNQFVARMGYKITNGGIESEDAGMC